MYKRPIMTQREMEKLADIVVTKLLMTLSSVNDAVQDQELNFLSNIITSDSEYDITEEEMLMGELARLQNSISALGSTLERINSDIFYILLFPSLSLGLFRDNLIDFELMIITLF